MACIYIMTWGWTNHNPFDASVQYALTVDSATVCAGWCVDVHVPAYKERAIRLNFSTTALKIMEPWPIFKTFHCFLTFSKILKQSEVWKNTKKSSGLKRKFKRSCWTLERSPNHVFFEWNRNSSANLSGQIQAQIQAASNPTEFQVFINFLKILMIFPKFHESF